MFLCLSPSVFPVPVLFLGSSGIGKTQLSKQIARYYNLFLCITSSVRLCLSLSFSVSLRLIFLFLGSLVLAKLSSPNKLLGIILFFSVLLSLFVSVSLLLFFLFLGSSGICKTELAKQIARYDISFSLYYFICMSLSLSICFSCSLVPLVLAKQTNYQVSLYLSVTHFVCFQVEADSSLHCYQCSKFFLNHYLLTSLFSE